MNTKIDLLKGSIFKSLLFFMIPILISRIFQQLYNTADIMIVGNFLGDEALAAMGASSSVYELLVGFAIGMGNGLSIVAARNFGTGNKTLLKRSVAGSIVIGIGITVVIMILSHFCLMPLLKLLKTPEGIIEDAYSYAAVLTLFVGVMFAYNLFAGLLSAIGDSVIPLVFLVFAAILNIFLDILFIAGFSMGVRGAAWATIVAQGISAVLCLIYIMKRCKILIPSKEHFEFQKELFWELIGQGLSMALMGSIVSAGTVILQSAINGFGYLVIAGHIAARKINSFCTMPIFVIGMALSTFVSQNRGANQGERVRKGVRYANFMVLIEGLVIMLALWPGAPALVKLLSGSNEKTVLDLGTWYMWLNAPFYVVLGLLFNLRFALQGLGRKLIPLVSSVIECIGKVLFVAWVIPKLGYLGVIICEPVIWCLMCLQLAYSFYCNPYIRQFGKQKIREKE